MQSQQKIGRANGKRIKPRKHWPKVSGEFMRMFHQHNASQPLGGQDLAMPCDPDQVFMTPGVNEHLRTLGA